MYVNQVARDEAASKRARRFSNYNGWNSATNLFGVFRTKVARIGITNMQNLSFRYGFARHAGVSRICHFVDEFFIYRCVRG